MPSPDTEELATVPLPAAAPDTETASQQRVEDPAKPDTTTEAVAAELAGPGADERAAGAVADEAASPESGAGERAAAEPAKPAKQGGRWWRGFTGSLAAGLAVLAVGVLAVAGACLFTGTPGPGPVLLIGHPVAAALALLAQRVADRRNGLPAAGAGIAVLLFTVSALTLFWLT